MQQLFVVNCERISRRQAYYVRFPINDQLIERIRELPDEQRKWSGLAGAWEVTTPGLWTIIKRYKGSTKIYFDFGSKDARKVFIAQIKKIEIAEEEKRKKIIELNTNKENWLKFKESLEETYQEHSEELHALLKEGIKLYPHQR